VEIQARVISVENTNAWAKAGVMIRNNLLANSKHAITVVTPGNGVAFQWRSAPGGQSSNMAGPNIRAPYWVRIIRKGNAIYSFASGDGVSWNQVGTAPISMDSTIYVGLCVTSHSAGTLCNAVFDNITINTDEINVAPIAKAGSDKEFTDGDNNGIESVILDGSGSYGLIGSYEWTENGTVISSAQKDTISMAIGTHTVILTVTDDSGLFDRDTLIVKIDNYNTVSDATGTIPVAYSLQQNYPNPFNPVTTFSYSLPEKSYVGISIFSINGELIQTLIKRVQDAGNYTIHWNASEFPSGVYLYRIMANNFTEIKRCILMK
jgi:hypothetical protein